MNYPESITVTITKEHCNGRQYLDCLACPLHAALKELFPSAEWISVSGEFARVGDSLNLYHFNLWAWNGGRMREILATGNPCTFTLYRDKEKIQKEHNTGYHEQSEQGLGKQVTSPELAAPSESKVERVIYKTVVIDTPVKELTAKERCAQ